MILGVGVDITKISRFISLYKKHGTKILERIFHEKEIESGPELYHKKLTMMPLSQNEADKQTMLENLYFYQYYASRWAAKEAFLKALGQGAIGSKCIWIVKNSSEHSNNSSNEKIKYSTSTTRSNDTESLIHQLDLSLEVSMKNLHENKSPSINNINNSNSNNIKNFKLVVDPLKESRANKPYLMIDDYTWNILEEQFDVTRDQVKLWCSLSHEDDYAIAQVIIEHVPVNSSQNTRLASKHSNFRDCI